MPDQIKIALVQVESRVGQVERNVAHASELVVQAANEGSDLIVLPEFFNTGYFPLYWDYQHTALAESESGKTVSSFRKLARDTAKYIVVPFYELEAPGLYYDTAVVLSPSGDTIAKYRKTHPPARLSLEKIYYRGGSRLPVFDVLGWRLGILICYDNYITEPARALMVQGVEIVIAPFAEVEGFEMWAPILRTRAFENGVYVAACNLVGPDSEPAKAIMSGASLVIDPEGVVLDQAPGGKEAIVRASLTRDRLLDVRSRRQFIRDRRPELYGILSASEEDARNLTNGPTQVDVRQIGAGVLPPARDTADWPASPT